MGADLTRRAGLADRMEFRHGNALEMPFGDASFDVAWTQHSSGNVEDKERLYREIRRVGRPGGRLAMHEIMTGVASRRLIAGLGFKDLVWTDESAVSLAWFRRRLAAQAGAAPPVLWLHHLLGQDTDAMFRNLVRHLEEGRVAVVMAVWQR